MGKKFYISDLHFLHKGILKQRPQFASVQEMDRFFVEQWRGRVSEEDLVYIVGDLFGYRADNTLLSQLTGQKMLVRGNHELQWLKQVSPWQIRSSAMEMECEDGGRLVRMSHYPSPELYDEENENAYLLYGHLHLNEPRREDWQELAKKPRALNVGADLALWANVPIPLTLDEWIAVNKAYRSAEKTV